MDSIHDVIRFYAKEPLKVTPQASFYRQAAIYRVQMTDRCFGVKKFIGTTQELQFVTEFLDHLERNGYAHGPRLVRTREGDPYVLHQSNRYFAMTWHPKTVAFDASDPMQLQAAATAIAELHEISRTFENSLSRRQFVGREPVWWQQKHREFAKGYQLLCKKHPNHPFTKLMSTQMPLLLDESERATEVLNGRAMTHYLAQRDVRHTVCHRDITNPNLLYDKRNETLHLIDFDSSGYSLPLVDLDKFLSNCLNWNPRHIVRAVSAYHAVLPLSAEASYLLIRMMSLPKEEWFLQAQFLAAPHTKAKQQRLTAQLKTVLQRKKAKRQAIVELIRFRYSSLGREFSKDDTP